MMIGLKNQAPYPYPAKVVGPVVFVPLAVVFGL